MRTLTLQHALRLPVFLLLAAFLAVVAAQARAAEPEPILVGRIAHIEGKLLRYIEEEKDWVLTVKDAPFGLEDTLYADNEAKAEFILPNSTWVRVGADTQIELIALHEDATTVDVASGLARFYNRSVDGVVKVTTPFGYVVALGDTSFDLYVGDESLEVVAVRGVVDFVHEKTGNKYEIREGTSSLIADNRETTLGTGAVDRAWDDWNADRDSIWAKRLEASRQSAAYLPAPIRDDSYALEENGRWERVYYEGSYRDLWRPTRVDPGWRPFTAGRWVVYYGDNCWVPDEPFGYVTHHYGSWVYVDSFRSWYWAPPAPRLVVDEPTVFIGFGWYPGRVGWFHSGESVGWVPLAPNEVYYGHRHWGNRRTVLVDNSVNISINIGSYRYLDEAVVIRRDHFYREPRYTSSLDRSVNRTMIVNNYQPITVINNTVINNYNTDRRRYAIHEGEVARKPHFSSMQRIETNQVLRRDADRQRGGSIRQELNRIIATAEPKQRAEARPVTLTSRMVEATKVSQPMQDMNRATKDIKPKNRERRVEPEQRRTLDSTLFQAQGARADRTGREQSTRSPREIEAQRQKQDGPVGSPLSTEAAREQRGREDRPQDAAQTPTQDGERRLRSPREIKSQQSQQADPAGAQVPEKDRKGPRNVEDRRRQREVEQRQQQESEQGKQQEIQRQQQDEGRRGQQEAEQRKQQDVQRQQQDEGRRGQQEAEQRKQQDVQRQQQDECRRGQQEAEQRKQQDVQRQQQEESRRGQQEAEQRKQQAVQKQQQDEGRRRQQEAEQRKQQDVQRQQQDEGRRRQQEAAKRQQQEAQRQAAPPPQKKTKKQLEEEELLKQQQQQQQQPHGRNK